MAVTRGKQPTPAQLVQERTMEIQAKCFELSRELLELGQYARALNEFASGFDLVDRPVPAPIPFQVREPNVIAFPRRRALASSR